VNIVVTKMAALVRHDKAIYAHPKLCSTSRFRFREKYNLIGQSAVVSSRRAI